MSKRVLCKFFAHGACLKGDNCEFSHDWKAPPNNICTYYQRGMCAYGSRCRYEHVKASRSESAASSSSAYPCPSVVSNFNPEFLRSKTSSSAYPCPSVVSNFNPEFLGSKTASSEVNTLLGAPAVTKTFAPSTNPAWNSDPTQHTILDNGDVVEPRSVNPVDRPLCSFAAAGNCPRGDTCPHIHGDVCSTCGKHCLHPFRPEEREQHKRTCEKKQKHLEALKHSQEIECSVCLERVLSKTTVAERKFGLLSECDHPFCISCIRNWRSSSPSSGVDVNSALRTCPICRKLSYFVIPSVIWYSTQEEKQDIVDSYKEKLSSIDCKHFNFGNGNCPFGTSCFYKHAYQDGRMEEVVLRHLGAEDGLTVIAKDIRLSDFLGDLTIRISCWKCD
ncbi:putative RING-type E3 ubiquitin transferase C3H69 isoform X1 [Tripterygium wilfordii]|uniref:putative RING-type E3 ubiquitin transferase C3H69 isoform X1 n=2 Tax=Tripterygium wilfordii TaxID=458696 RepID=UPI0018F7FF20|nr:putative RING-type E3 ubiquitin transferase C3H69 isoform X1 [Tripterygium wilfordii]